MNKKINLKVTVKPDGDTWKTSCKEYSAIIGTGTDPDEALASLVENLATEFREGTFKLDGSLTPEVTYKIIELKAEIQLGTENHTLSEYCSDQNKHTCEKEATA